MADNIKVKNIYYMLSYAYQTLRETGFDGVGAEDFDNMHDLFAAILIHGVGHQIKRGLYRDYAPLEEPLAGLRGKIRLAESVRRQTPIRRKLVCAYDEFSVDSAHNQILKSTMMLLLLKGDVKPENKKRLRKLLSYFSGVTEIRPALIHADALKYHRNNAAYRMLINICRLIQKGLLLTTETGGHRLAKWLGDEQMHRLYEKFVLAYYQKEHPSYAPRAAHIEWDIADGANREFLPAMKSDITLTRGDRVLIIDTKWHGRTMWTNRQYDNLTFISSHLYQIFAYVKNKDRGGKGNVAGILLYAKTGEAMTPNSDFIMGGNRISLKTLDLDRDWSEIASQLEALCSWLELEQAG
ncbi:MAG: 5-methylcytosine-specific restriction endonuclease system specificity protein McrC [Candidatus Adiutrix sp.]|nr:5-methylcytosine-specific restriction endonuclease system specificity protein McrC [Candidatus Adiutrix sp.]